MERACRGSLSLALLLSLGLPACSGLGAQGPGAIPVAQRYDAVAGGYVPVVVDLDPEAVRAVQSALVRAGNPPGPVTGVLESRTRAALRDFQTARGLRITGLPDYETILALGLPVRRATAAEIARQNQRPTRDFDLIVIGPSDSIPTVGGIGPTPGGRGEPPPTPGAGAVPGEAGVEPVPEPGVGPAPDGGATGLPVPIDSAPAPAASALDSASPR